LTDSNVIRIAYGKSGLPLKADPALADWHVIRPRFAAPLADPEAAFHLACRAPRGGRPLRELISPSDRVVIVTSDGTRAVPNRQLIPWLLKEMPVPASQITVLLGTGSHRGNTPAEIEAMFGHDVAHSLNIVNHDAFDASQNVFIGETPSGKKAYLDKRYVEADKRIVVGFIEPHFFAGFSGGAKGVIPAVASIDTILRIHGFDLIANPLSVWGTVEENPIRNELEAMVAHCPPDFLVNVTLNSDKAITGMFVGDYIQAHRAGCRRSRQEAMQPVPSRFPLVITSNSGFPLDQNLYQTIKGISAAARITEPGGTVLVASECSDGLPNHGNFGPLMNKGRTPDDILQAIVDLPEEILDQWEAQSYAYLMQKYDIRLFSAMDASAVRACKLGVVADFQYEVEAAIHKLGKFPSIGVLPDGPLTIPYLSA
jgi:nickel-dependent lactate racemase